jgi:IK cytokine
VGGSVDATAGTGAYRAVAPDTKGFADAAERRRRLIQESKFLGGDMEHTHLVKGLDFALLQKVRSEIASRENGEENEEDVEEKEEESETKKDEVHEKKSEEKRDVDPFQDLLGQCKSVMSKNIVR